MHPDDEREDEARTPDEEGAGAEPRQPAGEGPEPREAAGPREAGGEGPEPDTTAEAPAAEPPAPGERPAGEAGDAGADEPAPGEQPPTGAEPVGGPADAEAAVDRDRAPAQPDAAVQAEGDAAAAAESPGGGPEPAAEAGGEGAEAAESQVERQRRERGRRRREARADERDVIPGEHLEPDLVLEEERRREEEESEYARYAEDVEPEAEKAPEEQPVAAEEEAPAPAPAPAAPLDLAADARYFATGKRKTSVARVTLKPGAGSYAINGHPLDLYFPRETLQVSVRQPLEAAGYSARMDVVASIHGGGVAAQADALRHGVARALVDADPNLRTEMKRRGFLTRDARAKERKKAGLKKARKRPQFSKR